MYMPSAYVELLANPDFRFTLSDTLGNIYEEKLTADEYEAVRPRYEAQVAEAGPFAAPAYRARILDIKTGTVQTWNLNLTRWFAA